MNTKPEDMTDLEKEAVRGFKFYQDWDSGYSKQQSTRPQTLGLRPRRLPGRGRPLGSSRSSTSGRTATGIQRTC